MREKEFALVGDTFVMENYDRNAPFTGFLPGLAGVKGIPIWSFYTNRGQGINSFGIHNKANAMMEFNSAVTGYENAALRGFRTFVRLDGEYFEPFCDHDKTAVRRMEIEQNVLSVIEESHDLRITVRYIVLPCENIGALVRNVTIENLGKTRQLELLDGMPQIIVYGLTNGQYKEMSNLFKSWADIQNIENRAPMFTMRASSDDSSEVSEIRGGYFYCAVCDGALLPVIYDKSVVFDYDTSMRLPLVFMEEGVSAVTSRAQYYANKVPCAFAAKEATLAQGQTLCFTAYAGFAPSQELLNKKTAEFCREGYSEEKVALARSLVAHYTRDVQTQTADPLFDKYIAQCYLDNFLRGGYPFAIGNGAQKKIVHLFSRKHGDPERDYNFFSIAGEYYSQGNGNYRDVCQNRRNDVFFCPQVEDFNVHQFYNLVQLDGYNPLEIRPNTFVIPSEKLPQAQKLLRAHLGDGAEVLEKVIRAPFTPGAVTNAIAAHSLHVTGDEQTLVEELLALAEQRQEAVFGEGYWSDHWDYNLDLLQNFLLIYPERKHQTLFGTDDYCFYDSLGTVRPRRDTYVLNKGRVRQYGAVEHCKEKLSRVGFDPNATNWLRDSNGKIVTTSLFGKLLTLAINKIALLDSEGLGIEMDGGKPGWNDAMNGLPGLFGSSMPETIELERMVAFMREALSEQPECDVCVRVPQELADFMDTLVCALKQSHDTFECYSRMADAREDFRDKTKLCVSGKMAQLYRAQLAEALEAFDSKLHDAVSRALEIGNGIMPTYFTYEAREFAPLRDPDGTERISPYGLPSATVTRFERNDLPYFLEGPARLLAASAPQQRGQMREMCARIRQTDLYDSALKMYKTSGSIESLSMENGRVRAFTPGWLERESVFLHMEYKYFYGMLKAGLYEEFFEAIGDALIPYLDPKVYGRSILENSSFLASSVNPNPAVRGQGFVGRLSGSTVEMLSMWLGMFLGNGGFTCENGALGLRLAPILPGRMFDTNGEAAFMLCGSCRVTYHNPLRADTWRDVHVARMTARCPEGDVTVTGDRFDAAVATAVRDGSVPSIDVWLE